jgi:hypothetical protein
MEDINYITIPITARSPEDFDKSAAFPGVGVVVVNTDKVAHQLSEEHLVENVMACVPFASILIGQLSRFYKALDVVQLDKEYVLTCIFLAKTKGKEATLTVVLNEPVSDFFEGNHDKLSMRLFDVKDCLEFPVTRIFIVISYYLLCLY